MATTPNKGMTLQNKVANLPKTTLEKKNIFHQPCVINLFNVKGDEGCLLSETSVTSELKAKKEARTFVPNIKSLYLNFDSLSQAQSNQS